MKNNTPFVCKPAVCAVDNTYIIAVPVKKQVLMRVSVGAKMYYCHMNGIRLTNTPVQMFKVPMKELDTAKGYTIYYSRVLRGKAKKEKSAEEKSMFFPFRPLEKTENIKISLISDCHGRIDAPVNTAGFFGEKPDLLILNGDVISSSEKKKELVNLYRIASRITQGEIPVIISRGNHDLRGRLAEEMERYVPTLWGKTYFTVKLGALWFLLLDCGEDKLDSHFEYGGMVCCEPWRREETEFLYQVVQNKEYLSKDITARIIISHAPFPVRDMSDLRGRYKEPPFDIENEVYGEWCRVINESIRPSMLLAGHRHEERIIRSLSEENSHKIDCDIVVSGVPGSNKNMYSCSNLLLDKNKCTVYFTDETGRAFSQEEIKF